MVRREGSTLKWALFVGLAGGLGLIGASRADLVPGGGPAKSDCYAVLNVKGAANPGSTGNQVKNNRIITCTDGEACDQGACGDNACTFSAALCINQKDSTGTCTAPSSLDSVKVKAKGSVKLNVQVPQVLSGSVCGAFVDGTLTVPLKKNGKPKKVPQTKLKIVAKGPKGTKPRTDNDEVVFKCLPRTTPCPTTTTTTTPACVSTTTTTLVPPNSLTFLTVTGSANCGGAGINPPAVAPFSGQLFSDPNAATPITGGSLGLGCLYIGGGSATTVPPDRIPDGSTSILTVSGTNLVASSGTSPANCTKGVAPGFHCIGPTNTGMTCDPNNPTNPDFDCDVTIPGSCAPDAQCYFGPPLPIPNGPLTTCVLNVIKSDVSGTVVPSTGDTSISLPMFSRVYLTGNSTQPCPVCNCGKCSGGANDGGTCTPVGSLGTTLDCPPTPAQFLAPLNVTLGPLGNAAMMTAANGIFCPDQMNAGAFGKPDAKAIVETGMSPGNLTDNQPHPGKLASVFCIPATGNVAVDFSADIPGPGAIGLNGISQLHP
jgi:hypothetical protein